MMKSRTDCSWAKRETMFLDEMGEANWLSGLGSSLVPTKLGTPRWEVMKAWLFPETSDLFLDLECPRRKPPT